MLNDKEKAGAGINPISQTQYTDHLAVICYLMNIPLIFIDPSDHTLAQHYYPGLQASFVDYDTFSPEYLVANYDVLFMGDFWDKHTFHEKFGTLEMKYGKQLRHVYCPHGFSDKGFHLKHSAYEDIALIYGKNMIDQLQHHGVLNHLGHHVVTGNYRLTYFNQNRAFYDDMVTSEVLNRFIKKQPIILYAPTWDDAEKSSTFFDCYADIIGKLPNTYNMIVKLHPRLELDDAAKFYQIIGKYEEKPNVIFLKDFPPVYPLLAHTDLYLGDMSSIGYDFLTFNKPMFFLNKLGRDPGKDRGLYLFRCGTEVKADQFPSLYQLIEKNLSTDAQRYTSIRKEVYDYTFGPEKPFQQIKEEIIAAYNKPLQLTATYGPK